ncbi:hypothetical protein I4U23_017216 [Adineta vaga]|nr:hypothetical protein I4U23_017216 [Adineta vaga]
MSNEVFPQNPVYPIPEGDIPVISNKVQYVFTKYIEPYVSNVSEDVKKWLREIETKIYIIDHYGEHNKDIDPVILNALFEDVSKSMQKLTIPADVCEILLKDLKDYATIETEARYGKRFANYSIKEFYEKKSADLRMHRHMIRYLNGEKAESTETEIIQDILEDIYDDIKDLEEDKKDIYNGNRILDILRDENTEKLNEYILFAQDHSTEHPTWPNKIINGIKKILDNHVTEHLQN